MVLCLWLYSKAFKQPSYEIMNSVTVYGGEGGGKVAEKELGFFFIVVGS